MRRLLAVLITLGLSVGFLVAPAIATPDAASQASASSEIVENSKLSTRNVSVRIWERNNPVPVDMLVGPDVGVFAGPDRISSYYIPRKVCAKVSRGGVYDGLKRGPDRVGLAQGERIHILAMPC